MKKVLILHGYTTEYRVPFFKELNRILKSNNIALKVVIGPSSKYEKYAEIEDCPFFEKVHNRYFYFGKKYLLWEPVLGMLKGQDLIIMRQARKHLVNPLVFGYCKMKKVKTAFWGNMKDYLYGNKKARSTALIFKVDHWFAYNDKTKQMLSDAGYPADKATSVLNAIDSKSERAIYDAITEEELDDLREKLGIEKTDRVGLFCSRLYEDKRIDFLLNALSHIKERLPNFKFIVIGEGENAPMVEAFREKNADWFFCVGSKYGREKIQFFKLALFQLLPGAIGLHIIDSFALRTPIITTQSQTHGVEIDYLDNNKNGIMSENRLEAYVEAVLEFCQNKDLQQALVEGCEQSSRVYTIENMAQRFAEGIIQTLQK